MKILEITQDHNYPNGNNTGHNLKGNKEKEGPGRQSPDLSLWKSVYGKLINKKKKEKDNRKGENSGKDLPPIDKDDSSSTVYRRQKLRCQDLSKDLPNLHMEEIFKQSSFFQEFKIIFEGIGREEKHCLSCVAVFPENAVVKKRVLVHWWVGEGILESLVTQKKTSVEEIASDILKQFVDKKFIYSVNKKGRKVMNSFKMHPLVRSAVIALAQGGKDDSFFDYILEVKPATNFQGCRRVCLVDAAERSNLPNPGNRAHTNQEELETLFNVSNQFPDFTLEQFKKMKKIKVLYLGKWQSSPEKSHIEVESTEFLKGLKYMKHLRLFSLQGISGIREVPSSIKNLKSLRILDLKACYNLEKLPKEVGYLKMLSHLDISGCYLMDHMPKELSLLSQLQVLKGFVIGDPRYGNFCTLPELTKLEKLRKLSINVNSESFSIEESSTTLFKFKELLKLKIAWGGGSKSHKNSQQERAAETKSMASDKKLKSKKQKSVSVKSKSGNEVIKNGEDNKKKDSVSGEAKAMPTTQLDKIGDDQKQESVGKQSVTKQDKRGDGGKQNQDDGGDSRRPAKTTSNLRRRVIKVQRLVKVIRLFSRRSNNVESKSNIEKLDLQCFPYEILPSWLIPQNLKNLKKLYIRGGRLKSLGKLRERDEKWGIKHLRLKYLYELNMNWRELQGLFPKLQYLENFKCPNVTLCPCDGSGVWRDRTRETNPL